MNQMTSNLINLSALIASAHLYNSSRDNSSLINRYALLDPDKSPWNKLMTVTVCYYAAFINLLMSFLKGW